MKQTVAIFLLLCLLLSGCQLAPVAQEQHYTETFLDLFDTVTTVVGRAENEEAFHAKAQTVYEQLQYYHSLFDIYNDHEGINNLKTVNDNAGVQPVQVDPTLIDFLLDCKSYYALTGGRVNVAMGGVLALWHEARSAGINDPEAAALPSMDGLQEAAKHSSIDSICIDVQASTVYLSDPMTRLDVGAVAKGWATQRVAENAPEGMLISVGGNVCATGPKKADGTAWVIGVQHPERAEENLYTLYLRSGSVVTSGDYQRTYTVDGKAYHHIIDPDTLMPATYWRSVSVLCEDSGLADALSTGLFLMDLEQGKQLAQQCNVQVLWVDATGAEYMTDGFRAQLRS